MQTEHAVAPQLAASEPRATRDWRSMLEMAPSGARLFSPSSTVRQGLELAANAAHTSRFNAVLTSAQSHLRDANIPLRLHQGEPPSPSDSLSLTRSKRRWLGQLALELYFTQLYRSEVAVIDLSPSRFGVDGDGDAVWSPRPLYLRWDRRFREGLRDFYAGFFFADDARFGRGIAALGLEDSATVLVQHFGGDDQRSVRFGADALRQTLGAMVTQRRAGDKRLHRNFIAFGLYLTSLHELLECLDMRFDVRAAFMRSYPGSSHR